MLCCFCYSSTGPSRPSHLSVFTHPTLDLVFRRRSLHGPSLTRCCPLLRVLRALAIRLRQIAVPINWSPPSPRGPLQSHALPVLQYRTLRLEILPQLQGGLFPSCLLRFGLTLFIGQGFSPAPTAPVHRCFRLPLFSESYVLGRLHTANALPPARSRYLLALVGNLLSPPVTWFSGSLLLCITQALQLP